MAWIRQKSESEQGTESAPAPEPTGATTAPLRDPALEEGAAETQPVETAPETKAAPAEESPTPETVEEESTPESSEGAPVDELSEGTEEAPKPKAKKGFFRRMWDTVTFSSDEE